ncbi:hypothetical protein CGRA01v4_07881 [Colletotrichum graminicola]|nr:hypothetical protein CGRA01v4_07881 [Colletotrichum graminicola]
MYAACLPGEKKPWDKTMDFLHQPLQGDSSDSLSTSPSEVADTSPAGRRSPEPDSIDSNLQGFQAPHPPLPPPKTDAGPLTPALANPAPLDLTPVVPSASGPQHVTDQTVTDVAPTNSPAPPKPSYPREVTELFNTPPGMTLNQHMAQQARLRGIEIRDMRRDPGQRMWHREDKHLASENKDNPNFDYCPSAILMPASVLGQTYRIVKDYCASHFTVHVFYKNKANSPAHRVDDTIADTKALVALFDLFRVNPNTASHVILMSYSTNMRRLTINRKN